MRTTIAIGSQGVVSLWCRVNKRTKTCIYFSVINGAWDGKLKDGKVYVVKYPQHVTTGEVLWEGKIPFPDDKYNEAIGYIQDILDGKEPKVSEPLVKPSKFYEGELWEADPNCKHELDPKQWSGVKCLKCGGWFCY